jgi:hypothetical protein
MLAFMTELASATARSRPYAASIGVTGAHLATMRGHLWTDPQDRGDHDEAVMIGADS